MSYLLWVFMALSLLLNAFLIVVCVRFSRRLLQFDDLFGYLVDDIDVNMKFFGKLLNTPLFDNSQEVRTANNNMLVIAQRLDEFVNRMEDVTGRKMRKAAPSAPNPPVVR